jgi:hypothetical protein
LLTSPLHHNIHQKAVGRPFRGFPLFFASLSNSFALRCPIFTFLIPPCCFSFTFISRIGRLPTYLPVARRSRSDQHCEWIDARGSTKGNLPSISFHAFKKSSGSVKAINPYFALSDNRSLTTLHLQYDGYLAKAALSVLSFTSFDRSPTNRRNHATCEEVTRLAKKKEKTALWLRRS